MYCVSYPMGNCKISSQLDQEKGALFCFRLSRPHALINADLTVDPFSVPSHHSGSTAFFFSYFPRFGSNIRRVFFFQWEFWGGAAVSAKESTQRPDHQFGSGKKLTSHGILPLHLNKFSLLCLLRCQACVSNKKKAW